MQVWYLTAVSALYGMAVFFYMMAVMASPEGKACSYAYTNRYNWITVEIIYFWILFFIFQVPFLLMFCFSKERLHEIMNAESEHEEDD